MHRFYQLPEAIAQSCQCFKRKAWVAQALQVLAGVGIGCLANRGNMILIGISCLANRGHWQVFKKMSTKSLTCSVMCGGIGIGSATNRCNRTFSKKVSTKSLICSVMCRSIGIGFDTNRCNIPLPPSGFSEPRYISVFA